MTNDLSTLYILNDNVGLPISISNLNAVTINHHHASQVGVGGCLHKADDIPQPTPLAIPEHASPRQCGPTSFTEYVDVLWKNMSGRMRRKLRDACVEIVRWTDDAEDDHKFPEREDDYDTRLLD